MFNFYANADVEVGDELMISYGDYRSSYNFLLYCGFIPTVRPIRTFCFGATFCDVLCDVCLAASLFFGLRQNTRLSRAERPPSPTCVCGELDSWWHFDGFIARCQGQIIIRLRGFIVVVERESPFTVVPFKFTTAPQRTYCGERVCMLLILLSKLWRVSGVGVCFAIRFMSARSS
jgi:hypothetical protein